MRATGLSGPIVRAASRLLLAALLMATSADALAARGLKPLEVKQNYRAALMRLAAGEDEAALADLIAFEQEAVGDSQPWRYTDNLWRAKLRVIRDLLATQQVELLRPIIVLHHDAYFEYSRLGRRHLAHHSRTMTGELAEVYAARAATDEAATYASWVMISFAAYLWSPSNIGESADFFFLAKTLDPGNSTALEGLAAAYERGGNYASAIESLVLAQRRDADDPELELRLALCRLRSPEEDEAVAIAQLQQLTDSRYPQWIRSVAFQELALRTLAEGSLDRAEADLRTALSDLPGDQQLSVLLASVLDRQRRPAAAVAVLDDMRLDGPEADSPRLTYDFWMPPDVEQIRLQLHSEMESGRAALGSSLEAGGGA